MIAAVRAYRASLRRKKPKLPVWYVNAKTLVPMWAWFAWRDHGHPAKLRPKQIPHAVPAAWWTRYARHAGSR